MPIDRNTPKFSEPEPITPREFCARTGRSYGSVVNMMDRNQLPVHREGRPSVTRRSFISVSSGGALLSLSVLTTW
ncbi:hypothetical protein ACQ8FT_003560 [Yersinia enterocolitica]